MVSDIPAGRGDNRKVSRDFHNRLRMHLHHSFRCKGLRQLIWPQNMLWDDLKHDSLGQNNVILKFLGAFVIREWKLHFFSFKHYLIFLNQNEQIWSLYGFCFYIYHFKYEILHLNSSGRVPKKLAFFFHQIQAPPATFKAVLITKRHSRRGGEGGA